MLTLVNWLRIKFKIIFKDILTVSIVLVAQLVERWSYEPPVEGSNPSKNILI